MSAAAGRRRRFGVASAIVAAFVATIALSPRAALSKVVRGELRTGYNWQFVTRFCFLSNHGKFAYWVEYDVAYAVQNIDLYYDTEEQWYKAYGDESTLTTCREKESVLQVENNQFVNLTVKLPASGCQLVQDGRRIRCEGKRNFNTARDRWWFVAVSNCQSTNGLEMTYEFVMTNGPKGDLLHRHFSADEFYILPILIVASTIHYVLLALTMWFAIQLKGRQLLHATYKLFVSAVLLHALGATLMCAHYLVYGLNGIGLEKTKLAGRVLESGSEMVFLLLLILLAKGYTVTRARLRPASSIKVTIFVCCYTVVFSILFVYEQVYFDPGLVLYLYDSVAGIGLVSLRILGWCMFIYSTFFTLKHYPDKWRFYIPFFCFYTLWFIFGPIFVVVSNHKIPLWVREKVMVSIEHFIVAIGHLFLLLLTRPSAHNKNFPYHVRTSQIGIMEAMSSNAQLGNNTLDSFAHGGSYGVTSDGMDIFTVDGTGSAPQPPTQATHSPPPPYTSSLPQWSIAKANGGNNNHPEDNGKGKKIYDPNDDADSLHQDGE